MSELKKPRWLKMTRSNAKAHWMRWFNILGYWQPLCHEGDESNFYGSGILEPSEHNKCKACLNKLGLKR